MTLKIAWPTSLYWLPQKFVAGGFHSQDEKDEIRELEVCKTFIVV